MLRHFPRAGHAGQAPETLEWVVRGSPYVVVYEIIEDDVVILGVFHGAQDRE
jgi:plasmid stabilization system protein ParE